ncbi:Angiopoietin-related protein 5 [Tupaia chinensis]|uniref:Angiopoietin-related protein 5 n=1 Tax=Tupaia chinensis TaxID=246437 RepID=L9JEM8_TUPCH|nr:Angiopoietin-related protein 5 [Tupaia chinensis]
MATCLLLLLTILHLSVALVGSMVQPRVQLRLVLLEPQGRDCSQIWVDNPGAGSSIYTIQPEGANAPFQSPPTPTPGTDFAHSEHPPLTDEDVGTAMFANEKGPADQQGGRRWTSGLPPPSQVFCDMREDGGWTVIQRREWGTEQPLDFERCWQEYKQGFGDLGGDHWLGLQHISDLTSQPGLQPELSVDLQDVDNLTWWAHYDYFHVDKEDHFYRLSLGQYSGNAGDAFRGSGDTDTQEGRAFSTLDRDHDSCEPCEDGTGVFTSCSRDRSGVGWWYSNCGQADLNKPWPGREGDPPSLHWATVSSEQALRSIMLRVRTAQRQKA